MALPTNADVTDVGNGQAIMTPPQSCVRVFSTATRLTGREIGTNTTKGGLAIENAGRAGGNAPGYGPAGDCGGTPVFGRRYRNDALWKSRPGALASAAVGQSFHDRRHDRSVHCAADSYPHSGRKLDLDHSRRHR
jgi:hypothetical protein